MNDLRISVLSDINITRLNDEHLLNGHHIALDEMTSYVKAVDKWYKRDEDHVYSLHVTIEGAGKGYFLVQANLVRELYVAFQILTAKGEVL